MGVRAVATRAVRALLVSLAATVLASACTTTPAPSEVPLTAAPPPAPRPAEPPPPPPATFAVDAALAAVGVGAERATNEARVRWQDRNDATAPLSPRARAIVGTIQHDPPPPAITRNTHYWTSNERAHEVWQSRIVGIEGAHIGVGTDQNYVLAGWARSTLLVLLDFDMAIVDLHRAYHAAFLLADEATTFVELWDGPDPRVMEQVEALYADDPEAIEATRAAVRVAHGTVYRRLRGVRDRHRAMNIASLFTDPAQYRHIRQLWENGRVLLVRGDLTGPRAMLDVAARLDEIGVPAMTFYLSNAEVYFQYEERFRRNVSALPYGEGSCVLRTAHAAYLGNPPGEPDYHFAVQSGDNLRAWMMSDELEDVWDLFRVSDRTEVHGMSELVDLPRRPSTFALEGWNEDVAAADATTARLAEPPGDERASIPCGSMGRFP